MERQLKVEADLRRDLDTLHTRLETNRRGHEAEGQMYQVISAQLRCSPPSPRFNRIKSLCMIINTRGGGGVSYLTWWSRAYYLTAYTGFHLPLPLLPACWWSWSINVLEDLRLLTHRLYVLSTSPSHFALSLSPQHLRSSFFLTLFQGGVGRLWPTRFRKVSDCNPDFFGKFKGEKILTSLNKIHILCKYWWSRPVCYLLFKNYAIKCAELGPHVAGLISASHFPPLPSSPIFKQFPTAMEYSLPPFCLYGEGNLARSPAPCKPALPFYWRDELGFMFH